MLFRGAIVLIACRISFIALKNHILSNFVPVCAADEKITNGTRFSFLFFFLQEQFYNNNEAQIWLKVKNNVRTIQAGI